MSVTASNYAVTCEVVSDSCSPSVASESAVLRGPGGGTVAAPPILMVLVLILFYYTIGAPKAAMVNSR